MLAGHRTLGGGRGTPLNVFCGGEAWQRVRHKGKIQGEGRGGRRPFLLYFLRGTDKLYFSGEKGWTKSDFQVGERGGAGTSRNNFELKILQLLNKL